MADSWIFRCYYSDKITRFLSFVCMQGILLAFRGGNQFGKETLKCSCRITHHLLPLVYWSFGFNFLLP